jgi:hypothetical protein
MEQVVETICMNLLKGLFAIMVVFVDRTKTSFNQVKKIKKEKK